MTVSASFCNLFVYSLIQSGLPQSGRQKAQGNYFCILVQTREQQDKCPWSIRGCWSFLQSYRATGTTSCCASQAEHWFTPFLLDIPKFRFPLKHILNKYQSLQCTWLPLKTAAPKAETGFTAHKNTLLLFFYSTLKYVELSKQHIQKVYPHRGMSSHTGSAQKLLLPGGNFQVSTCSRARTDISPPSGCGRCCVCLATWSIPLIGLLLHTSIWLIFTWLPYQQACERPYR